MPVALCSLWIRYETADLYERTIAPNEPGFDIDFVWIIVDIRLVVGAQQCCASTIVGDDNNPMHMIWHDDIRT